MEWFEIKPESEGAVKLDEKTLKGELTFKVTNVSGKSLRARAAAIPQADRQKDWMSVKGEDIREMADDAEETFIVSIAAPKGAKPGAYAISFVVCNEADPEEETAEVKVKFEIAESVKVHGGKRPVWPWIAGGVAAVLVVGIVVGVAVYLMSPPHLVADFALTNPFGTSPLTVSFRDQSQGAPDSWKWTFGTAGTSTDQNPKFTFTKPGIYGVTLKVTRGSREAAREEPNCISVTPAPVPPIAQFKAEALVSGGGGTTVVRPTLPNVEISPLFSFRSMERRITRAVTIRIKRGQAVQFIDLSKGDINRWSWNFGDGSGQSQVQHPKHTYSRTGTFSVSLTVTGPGGSKTAKKPNFVRVE